MRAKIAVVFDRHPLRLQAMEDLLRDAGIEVVGTATSIADAVALVGHHRPDVLVAGIDCSGQDEEGVIGLRRAHEAHPGVRSVVVADGDDSQSVEAAFAAGASIYCVRTAERGDLASAIRQAFQHSIYVATNEHRGASPSSAPTYERDSVALAPIGQGEVGLTRPIGGGKIRPPLLASAHADDLGMRSGWMLDSDDGRVVPGARARGSGTSKRRP